MSVVGVIQNISKLTLTSIADMFKGLYSYPCVFAVKIISCLS